MAPTYSSFTCFDEVVSHYNNITPLRGSTNAGKDIRPIGDRERKWERVVKISRNCYALSDGYHMGDEHFSAWMRYDITPPTLTDMEKYAPIVWRKKHDGTEEVTLRNGYGEGQHNSRYNFLWRHTPHGLKFRMHNGKHFIWNHGTEHYLAKTRTARRPVYAGIKKAAANKPPNHWSKYRAKWVRAYDDNSAVTFRKNENGGWDHVEGTGKDKSCQNPTVNKVVKAKYKDDIKKFFEWGMVMSPLLPLEDMGYATKHGHWLYTHFKPDDHLGYGIPAPKPTDLRKVVSDENHPMRLALWVTFAAHCTDKDWGHDDRDYYVKTIETKEDLQRVRSRYNTWVNITLGFMTKKEDRL